MKAIDLLINLSEDRDYLGDFSVASIYSYNEKSRFDSMADLICGGVNIGHDYLVTTKPVPEEKVDAVYRSYENGSYVFCYVIE